MQKLRCIAMSLVTLLLFTSFALAEIRFAMVVLTYNCNAATLSRVEDVVDLLPEEAELVVLDETLCSEVSRIFAFGESALTPSTVAIIKPPASVDMSEAGYLVVIKKVVELGEASEET